MHKLSTTSADGVSIGEPRSEQVQTDLDGRVTSEWSERGLLYSWSVHWLCLPELWEAAEARSIAEGRLVQVVDRWHEELLEGGSSGRIAAAVFHALVAVQ